ncbi:uncharacterized protein LOC101861002 isoform X2 [Aplysia californica]|uniref:Uncharacterized protein LOC101861002 isoform X2 n=1 Tax=Aplysia californica TaxID=6500 RepID=A0ABM1AA21_APLCA|nr:uncharacterized protein LOC101861002 isoform X2 [Aplysia californica]
MDSRLLAGAYSQHFRALEKEELEDRNRFDTISKAKRLSQETNKRRKIQAHKRKLEAQREEKRRQEILSKRREEQNQATEKYQRSHIPPSSRQGSGRLSPRRHTGTALEDALTLIRGNPQVGRPHSNHHHVLSPGTDNADPLEKSYFDQTRHHSSRPSSGRPGHQMDPDARAEMMDHSMKNLTSSRSLFEQQLEQQQNMLFEQQQQALLDFNNAIRREIDRDFGTHENEGTHKDSHHLENDDTNIQLSDSCSSLDSLEGSKRKSRDADNFLMARGTSKPLSSPVKQHPLNSEDSRDLQPSHNLQPEDRHNLYLLNNRASDNTNSVKGKNILDKHQPLNQDMTTSATFQRDLPVAQPDPHLNPSGYGNIPLNSLVQMRHRKENHNSFVGLTRGDLMGDHGGRSFAATGTAIGLEKCDDTVKQLSEDSLLDSASSCSSISVIKMPDNSPANKHKPNSQENVSGTVSAHDRVPVIKQGSKEHQVAGITTGAVTSSSTAWVSPSPQLNSCTLTETSTPTQNDLLMSDFHPRYASAIGQSIWPGNNPALGDQHSSDSTQVANNQHPYSTRGTLTSMTSTTPFPITSGPHPVMYSAEEDMSPVSAAGSSTQNYNRASNFVNMTAQDMSYPLSHIYPSGGISSSQIIYYSQSQASSSTVLTTSQYKGNTANNNINYGLADITKVPISSVQSYQQVSSTFQQRTSPVSHIPSVPCLDTSPEPMQTHISQAGQMVGGPIPVPAVRTVFPKNCPPAPTSTSGNASATLQVHWEVVNCPPNLKQESSVSVLDPSPKEALEEADELEMDSETVETEKTPLLRGILKQATPKVLGQATGRPNQVKTFPRDSLELARMNPERKGKKKSVRFADHQIKDEEDNTTENNDSTGTKGLAIINTGTHLYKPAVARPLSAKVTPATQRVDSTQKAHRTASAGTVRTAPSSQTPVLTPSADQNSSNDNSSSSSAKSNLPPSHCSSLNTTTSINRPKAAAHIIMSPDHHAEYKTSTGVSEHSPPSPSSGAAASTAHKSHFEAKVKAVNNNFMTKVPVKVPVDGQTNGVVYQTTRVWTSGATSGQTNDYGRGDPLAKDTNSQQQQKQALSERGRISASKRVPVSNASVSRTSKIAIQQANNGIPTYANINNDNSNKMPVYDENGIRIDRTPTDEEITWLWDKVRNCLTKEDEKNSNKTACVGSGDQAVRTVPTLSTKIIDGASLGVGGNNAGMTGLRTGSGCFYPRTSPATATPNNKVKPALQQQGSYLRRYGLLKQRRVQSASALGPSVPVITTQRATSAIYGRQPSQPPTSDNPPTPIAFSYKPQDNVSESTAAFMMAERLAKQSLTDSHIQTAMEDAKNKQELHNLVRNRGGQSALSIEEQRLMESLDRLNDRLKVNDPKSNGTIHYHQPYQPHKFS